LKDIIEDFAALIRPAGLRPDRPDNPNAFSY
jgi:hypothetical protein